MKFKFNKRPVKKEDSYENDIKSELKNNSIVLSFALSIIIIGIISIFYKNSNNLLIGIAISSLLLTIIQCISNGNTILNILPIFTMLIFGFFPKTIENIPGVNILLKDDFCNLIIFLAFSLTFLTQAYKNIIFKHEIDKVGVECNKEKNKMITAQLEIIKNIKVKTSKIKSISEEKGLYDLSFNKAINDLDDYVENETFINNVKSTLINKGSEDQKSTFNIEEVEESILLNSGVARRKINATKEIEEVVVAEEN